MINNVPEPPPNTRGFFDPEGTRKNVLDYTQKAFETKLNSLETNKYKLRVSNLKYTAPNKQFSPEEQKNGFLQRKDLSIPLKGTVEMIDKSDGRVVATKNTTIANVPWVTDRNTFMLNGSEYIVTNQQRLKSGVYTRIKDSGEAEAHINVLPGTGIPARIVLHPHNLLLELQVQKAKIPLYGILRGLNIPDEKIKQAWGEEIFLKNKMKYKGDEIDRLYEKIIGKQINIS